MGERKSRIGRPPAGERGERVTDYAQVSLRLPPNTRAKLAILGRALKQPQWRVIVDCVDALFERLPAEMRGHAQKEVGTPKRRRR